MATVDKKAVSQVEKNLMEIGAAMKNIGIMVQQHEFTDDAKDKMMKYITAQQKDLQSKMSSKNVDIVFSLDLS